MADLHFQIVDYVHKMKHERAVGAAHHHVGRVRFIGIVDGHIAADQIAHGHGATLETKPPGTVAFINPPGIDEFFKIAGVNFPALALKIRTVRPTRLRAFIPVEAEPRQAIENRLPRFVGVARFIGVLHPQDELTAVFAGKQPAKQRGTRAAYVKIAGGRRCESGSNSHELIMSRQHWDKNHPLHKPRNRQFDAACRTSPFTENLRKIFLPNRWKFICIAPHDASRGNHLLGWRNW